MRVSKPHIGITAVLIVAGMRVGAAATQADHQTNVGDEVVVTERGGTRFLSLRDWPVKEEGNVVRPVPLEEYLSLKFTQVSDALGALERRLGTVEQKLQTMDQDRAELRERLRDLEAAVRQMGGQPTEGKEEPDGHATKEREAASPQGERP